mmetsp:Transcript_4199/g.12036  ORF Transcript_4199/g.12036 Transcript_4199/m.12036 type:complete len:101 (+) Transcript_4199:1242-1544(+)
MRRLIYILVLLIKDTLARQDLPKMRHAAALYAKINVKECVKDSLITESRHLTATRDKSGETRVGRNRVSLLPLRSSCLCHRMTLCPDHDLSSTSIVSVCG